MVVTFRGKSLKEIQKAAVSFAKAVPEMKVVEALATKTDQWSILTIGLVKKKLKE